MKQKDDYIRRLYIEKVSGILTETDEIELKKLLDQDADALNYWNSLEKMGDQLQLVYIVDRLDTPQELLKFKRKVSTSTTVSLVYKKWFLSSVAAVFLIALYLFIQPFTNTKYSTPKTLSSTLSQSSASTKDIVLESYDGIQFVLSKESIDRIAQGEVIFINEKGTLAIKGTSKSREGNGMNKLYIPHNEDFILILPDGSKVYLNANTELQFPNSFDEQSFREVYLKGEGFFEVVSNAKQPFIIHTSEAAVEVKGTILNVCAYDNDQFTTSLLEGKVAVSTTMADKINLLPGNEAFLTKEGRLDVKSFERENILLRKKGIYIFDKLNLKDLSAIIYNWYGITMKFENESLAEHQVSGLMEKRHIEEFLNDLKTTTGLDYSLQDRVLLLKKEK